MPLKLNRTLYTVNADLNTKASVDSPALEGTPTAPTPSVGDNSTKLATTAFVAGAAGNLLRITTFESSGTWTKQADVARILVQVVGGGGNGGNMTSGTGPSSGGGGGGASIKLIDGSSLLSSESVTIGGAGGASSFGSHCSATGGSAGAINYGNGGAGGVGSGGNLNLTGQRGAVGIFQTTGSSNVPGAGGNSPLFTGGGVGTIAGFGTAGVANSGGGGSGRSGSAGAGFNAGASGIVIIYEYGY